MKKKHPLNALVDFLLFLKNTNPENFRTDVRVMSAFFEDVLDGCIFELYFEQHMAEQGIAIFEEVKKGLQDNGIVGLTELEAKECVWQVYQTFSASDSAIRQRMALFGARSPDILLPIMRGK